MGTLMDYFHRLVRVYTSNEALLAGLAKNAKSLGVARDTPTPLAREYERVLRTRRNRMLTLLRANRIEARRLLVDCTIR